MNSNTLEAQIEILKGNLSRFVHKDGKYPKEYYALKGKIAKLKKQLFDMNKQNWLAQ